MAGRRSSQSPPPPEIREFSPEEIERGMARLTRRIEDVKALDPATVPADDQRVENVEHSIRKAVLETFGPNSPEYRQHQWHEIWKGVKRIGMDSRYMQKCFADGIPQTVTMLEGLVKDLDERRAEYEPERAVVAARMPRRRVVGQAIIRLRQQLQTRNDDALHKAISWFKAHPDAQPLHEDHVVNEWFAESLRAVQPHLADPEEQEAASDLYLELRSDGGVGLPKQRLELGFSIIEDLSSGHYGRVWKATVNGSQPPLVTALKRPLERDRLRLEAFQKEANCLGRLSNPGHPAIPRLIAVSHVPEEEFLAMEFMPGQPLGDWLRPSPALHLRRQVLAGLASALEYAHEHDTCHRDLKLGNVLATPDGDVGLLVLKQARFARLFE